MIIHINEEFRAGGSLLGRGVTPRLSPAERMVMLASMPTTATLTGRSLTLPSQGQPTVNTVKSPNGSVSSVNKCVPVAS